LIATRLRKKKIKTKIHATIFSYFFFSQGFSVADGSDEKRETHEMLIDMKEKICEESLC